MSNSHLSEYLMDPYEILGLKPGASEQDAKEAFRKLAKSCHPDLHPNDPEAEKRFKDINAAYDTIRNPPPNQHQFAWNAFTASAFAPGRGVDEIFAEVFGHRRNADVVYDYRMSLEEAFTGKDVNLTVPISGNAPRQVKVTIPPGIAHGMRLRVPQSGHHTYPGMAPGDLFLMISISPHDRFRREGNHLLTTISTSVFDVMLGKDIEVTGIDGGKLRLSIPPVFDSRRLRLTAQGMPDPFGSIRGDLYVDLAIQYPVLTDTQRALIRQAAES